MPSSSSFMASLGSLENKTKSSPVLKPGCFSPSQPSRFYKDAVTSQQLLPRHDPSYSCLLLSQPEAKHTLSSVLQLEALVSNLPSAPGHTFPLVKPGQQPACLTSTWKPRWECLDMSGKKCSECREAELSAFSECRVNIWWVYFWAASPTKQGPAQG